MKPVTNARSPAGSSASTRRRLSWNTAALAWNRRRCRNAASRRLGRSTPSRLEATPCRTLHADHVVAVGDVLRPGRCRGGLRAWGSSVLEHPEDVVARVGARYEALATDVVRGFGHRCSAQSPWPASLPRCQRRAADRQQVAACGPPPGTSPMCWPATLQRRSRTRRFAARCRAGRRPPWLQQQSETWGKYGLDALVDEFVMVIFDVVGADRE